MNRTELLHCTATDRTRWLREVWRNFADARRPWRFLDAVASLQPIAEPRDGDDITEGLRRLANYQLLVAEACLLVARGGP